MLSFPFRPVFTSCLLYSQCFAVTDSYSLLQMSIMLGNLLGISDQILFSVHGNRLFSFYFSCSQTIFILIVRQLRILTKPNMCLFFQVILFPSIVLCLLCCFNSTGVDDYPFPSKHNQPSLILVYRNHNLSMFLHP